MPSPEELGVATRVAVPKQQPATPATVDWNAIHAQMERLGVLDRTTKPLPGGGVRVTILLPTKDRTQGQPIQAEAQTEAAAIAAALRSAETWMQKR
jgi:hypothetical protein